SLPLASCQGTAPPGWSLARLAALRQGRRAGAGGSRGPVDRNGRSPTITLSERHPKRPREVPSGRVGVAGRTYPATLPGWPDPPEVHHVRSCVTPPYRSPPGCPVLRTRGLRIG